jgi:DinB superfamily
MHASAEFVTRAVTEEACQVFEQCLAKIKHCLDQLTEQQLWWRPTEDMNAIGNLILHLAGNVQQWIVAGIGGAADVRKRPAEFSERGPIPATELMKRLEDVITRAKDVLHRASADEMLSPRRIQGFETTAWGAVFDCVPHFKGHTQEIICLTRMQLGAAYRVHWQPQTPEEGAAH